VEYVMAHHILLVEDNPARAQRIRTELQSYGLAVDVLKHADTDELSTHVRQADAVLLSVDTLHDESYLLCHSLKASAHTSHIPVIMLCRDDEPRDVLAAFRAGAQDYILQDTFVIHNLVESLRRLRLL
jgi:two-component system cell cycle response regulator